MHICLDIDDTITYAPELFSLLAALADATITVVTFRTDADGARATLAESGVRFDRLITSSDPDCGKRHGQGLAQWKAAVVNHLQPDWFFEDMPEVVALIHPTIKVFMPVDELMRSWVGKAAGA
ncbi:MAG: hypothetical protein KDB14_34845 [Planctomycetales bacterium]|nr:hypothetical protein [Planctomycetales bacterium]